LVTGMINLNNFASNTALVMMAGMAKLSSRKTRSGAYPTWMIPSSPWIDHIEKFEAVHQTISPLLVRQVVELQNIRLA
jgi:hypothetical protein